MISTLIVESDKHATSVLETLLADNCPQISIYGRSRTYKNALECIEELKPDLVFLDLDIPQINNQGAIHVFYPFNFELIVTTKTEKYAKDALNCCASGYLLKPIQKDEIVIAVHNASRRISDRKRIGLSNSNTYKLGNAHVSEEVIGIPTTEGYEFVPVKNIVRCEGMQKCTRIIITNKPDLVSSYNLGKFRKMLDQFGFYSPHKSHLINLGMVRKYHKEGNIFMLNGSWVPVAKRRKKDFLNRMQHI